MRSIRQIQRKARRDLHERAKVAALYLANPNAVPVALTVRIHQTIDPTGMDTPTKSGSMVERRVPIPRLVFLIEELEALAVVLRRGGIVSVEAGEAYELDNSEPRDDLTQTWAVTPLDQEYSAGLPVPAVL
ncbi:hypothetical protein D2N39_11690 [Gemmobacter lutimaris]|uniref:Uncharacterized protein n=1 Tax=Gemmobacter lutimaris TaxID=2306023 RepID=A0A398BVI0_9RHOB|nr:hypothetical protein [Gemmobacter lutimaris]RID91890.1 hypothetical protein D2N39_11690 [Gemmobacter lutimaris]